MKTPARVTHTLTTVTPAMAQAWLTTAIFDKQRAVRQHHVAALLQAMRQGTFREGTVISFAILPNSKKVLINGQHTLHALVKHGAALRLSVEEHHIASEMDIAPLYASFDIHMRRSASDIYTAYDFQQRHHFGTSQTRSLSAAIPIIVGGFLGSTRSKYHPVNIYMSNNQNRLAVMEQWIDIADAYFQAFLGQVPAHHAHQAFRAMVAAVGIVTFRYRPIQAKEFWTQISHREHLSREMPAYRLIQYLESQQSADSRQAFAYSRGVAAAWNAFYTGRTLARGIVPRRSDLAMLIEGTPFDGKNAIMYFSEGVPLWNPVEVGDIPGQPFPLT